MPVIEHAARSNPKAMLRAPLERSVAASNGEPSGWSALERVVETSQRVISKHIDLTLLEARGAFTHMLHGLVAANIVVVLGCGAWFALAAAAVEACFTGMTARLLLFGLINACGALLATFALRRAS